MPATGWTNHDAAALVARQQDIPAAERRELLDMLGLLDKTGQVARPPDSEVDILVPATLNGAKSDVTSTGRQTHLRQPPPLNGKLCPPGLRALFEGATPITEPEQSPKQITTPAPKQTSTKPKQTSTKPKRTGEGRGVWRRNLPINHGSPNGSRQHRRRGEEPCEDCKQGRREYDARLKRQKYVLKAQRRAA